MPKLRPDALFGSVQRGAAHHARLLFNQGIYSLGNLAHCRGMSCTLMAQPSPGLG